MTKQHLADSKSKSRKTQIPIDKRENSITDIPFINKDNPQ